MRNKDKTINFSWNDDPTDKYNRPNQPPHDGSGIPSTWPGTPGPGGSFGGRPEKVNPENPPSNISNPSKIAPGAGITASGGKIDILLGSTFCGAALVQNKFGADTLGVYNHTPINNKDIFNWGVALSNPSSPEAGKKFNTASFTGWTSITKIGQKISVALDNGISQYSEGFSGATEQWTYVGYSTLPDGLKIIIFSRDGRKLSDHQEYVALEVSTPSYLTNNNSGHTEQSVPFATADMP